MQIPVRVSFRNMPTSDAVEAACLEEAERLERFDDRIVGCAVVVSRPHQHSQRGNLYEVRIEVSIPGEDVFVNRGPGQHAQDEDVFLALREAFEAARRQVQDRVDKRRHQVKHHDEPPQGRVLRLFPEDGYGFIETSDGRELYFHEGSVQHGVFGQLQPGDSVRFVEEEGPKGPRALSVRRLGSRQRGSPGAP